MRSINDLISGSGMRSDAYEIKLSDGGISAGAALSRRRNVVGTASKCVTLSIANRIPHRLFVEMRQDDVRCPRQCERQQMFQARGEQRRKCSVRSPSTRPSSRHIVGRSGRQDCHGMHRALGSTGRSGGEQDDAGSLATTGVHCLSRSALAIASDIGLEATALGRLIQTQHMLDADIAKRSSRLGGNRLPAPDRR